MNASSSHMEEKTPEGHMSRGQWTESGVVLTLTGPRVINPGGQHGCSCIYVTTALTMIPEPYELKEFLWGVVQRKRCTDEMHRYCLLMKYLITTALLKKQLMHKMGLILLIGITLHTRCII